MPSIFKNTRKLSVCTLQLTTLLRMLEIIK